MLPRWLVWLVLAAAAAVLPLQGFAQTLQIILCQPHLPSSVGAAHDSHAYGLQPTGAHEAHPHGGASTHEHASTQHSHDGEHAVAADAATAHHAAMADETSDDGHATHFCCDVVAAALPGSAPTIARFDFPVLEPALQVFHASAFLESPQRPPLA